MEAEMNCFIIFDQLILTKELIENSDLQQILPELTLEHVRILLMMTMNEDDVQPLVAVLLA